MTKLSPAQAALLALAMRADDGGLSPPDGAKRAIAGLIKRGLLICAPCVDDPSRLLITEAGKVAVGSGASPAGDRDAPPTAPPPSPEEAAAPPKGKITRLVELLRQPGGTTVKEMMQATGWQAHSIRGAMSGAIKKGLGLEVSSAKSELGRTYRIAEPRA